MMPRIVRFVSTTVAAICGPALVSAQIAVAPIRVELTDARPSGIVTLVNNGDRPMTMQPTLMLWTQEANGDEKLTPSRDVVVAPPLVEIAPKAQQVVRMMLRTPAAADSERTYRLVVREVPPQNAEGTGPMLKFALNLSIPVFVLPKAEIKAAPKVLLSGKMDIGGGKLLLDVANAGSAHLQAREIRFAHVGGLANISTVFYLLPGATKRVVLPLTGAASQTLSAQKQLQYEIITSGASISGVAAIN